LEQNVENVPNIIIVCCVLHNICQDKKERLRVEDQEFLEQVIIQERAANQNNNNIVSNEFNQQCFILTQYLQNINV